MAGEFAAEEGRAVQNGRAAEMRKSIDAVNAVRAGHTGNPAMVDAAAAAEAAMKMGAGPRSADFARVSSFHTPSSLYPVGAVTWMPVLYP